MPATAVVQAVLALGTMLAAGQETRTLVIAGAGLMVILVDADFVRSWVLVAVTIAVVGEVMVEVVERTPLGLIVPTEVDQVTAEE